MITYYMKPETKNYQSGQVGLVVLLVMVVMLTMGLSIMSQSTRDVTQSRQEEETTRVFNAAEAGIETALNSDFNLIIATETSPETAVGSSSEYQYSITPVTSGFTARVEQGHSSEVYLGSVGAISNIIVHWGYGEECDTLPNPASLIITIYGSTTRHFAYGCQSLGDDFDQPSSYNSNGYAMRRIVTLAIGDRLIRIRPVYNTTDILVSNGSFTLPPQGHQIVSTGTSGIGDETRAIEVNRTRPIAPSIFDYAVFSGGSLTK